MEYYVLGIDAAWTFHHPSGVALLSCTAGKKPRLLRIARSYEEFYAPAIDWQRPVKASPPALAELIAYCRQQGYPVQVAALDIPLSSKPVRAYREADRALTRQYARRGAAVHSPTAERPGPVADSMYEQLTEAGLQWASDTMIRETPSFIEVYPHASILELFRYPYRFPYKVHKKHQYWKEASHAERYRRIVASLNELRNRIGTLIENELLPPLADDSYYTTAFLKGYEDVLDSIMAALTAMYYREGKARAFGDRESGIWVPAPDATP